MKRKYSRREALEMGVGAAVLGACNEAFAAIKPQPAPAQKEESRMTTVSEFNQYGEDLEKYLILRSSPIAVKMLEKEGDIPKDAIRPKKLKYSVSIISDMVTPRKRGTTR